MQSWAKLRGSRNGTFFSGKKNGLAEASLAIKSRYMFRVLVKRKRENSKHHVSHFIWSAVIGIALQLLIQCILKDWIVGKHQLFRDLSACKGQQCRIRSHGKDKNLGSSYTLEEKHICKESVGVRTRARRIVGCNAVGSRADCTSTAVAIS